MFKYIHRHIMKYTAGFPSILSKTLIFTLLAWIAIQPEPVFAKIYKYKDDHGKTHFTDDASKIPVQFRKKDSVKKFKGVNEPAPGSGASSGFPGQKSTEKDGDKSSNKQEDAGLSSQDEGLVKKSIQIFKAGIALGNQYEHNYPTFPNGQGAVNDIQSALPQKEGLASELAGTKVPALKEALGFLKKSITVDKQTTSVGQGLTMRIAGIFKRLTDEAKQQTALIQKLEQALKDSEREKAEAAKKKEDAKKEKKK